MSFNGYLLAIKIEDPVKKQDVQGAEAVSTNEKIPAKAITPILSAFPLILAWMAGRLSVESSLQAKNLKAVEEEIAKVKSMQNACKRRLPPKELDPLF